MRIVMSIEHEASSGNVFADIGIKAPEEALAKAEVAHKISSIIKHRHLNQADAAKLLGWGRNTLTRKLKELSL